MSIIKANRRFVGGVLLNVLILGMILFFPVAVGFAQADDAPSRVLKAGVSKSLYLPETMYGYWSITGTLLETNSPDSFNKVLHDIWVLEQVGDRVVITNPASGASASVNVEKVEGETATFYHTVVAQKGRVFFEMPTVTVDGDTLMGTTLNEFRYLRNGKVSSAYYAKYRLEAKRIRQ